MPKIIGDTERFLVGWGRQGGRMAFFITHKELPDTKKNPIVCDPKEIGQKLPELANQVDAIRRSRRTK